MPTMVAISPSDEVEDLDVLISSTSLVALSVSNIDRSAEFILSTLCNYISKYCANFTRYVTKVK
ncbi:protein of unknown function [Vibrio tapetis subsp. tapetis]|uniref:Uncharacterized protein n=1 Tax=Vibrio tapetis subsp. tapetis TaxID=1671868 RepID=A0A2N8ZB57_9VIBR|nr:protein of unknown function [Vibrio tapetis subsp. tapetis]